jgi:hypothetical protein
MNGNIAVTLKNTDLVNNGIMAGGINTVAFTGNASSTISGTGFLRFFDLNIDKTGGQSVVLQKSIDIINSVEFTSGFLNLNGFNVDLETSGMINGENNNSRFVGTTGGEIVLHTFLNAPFNANPGNLGLLITSNQQLGDVTIIRGHQSQSGSQITSSTLRYYKISPANNNNLNATLRFNYLDGETNGLDENSLSLFRSENGINWSDIGFTSRDAAANFVEKAGINSVSRLTLSAGNQSVLPVVFVLFNINCEANRVLIKWRTSTELNSSYFDVEKSADGIHWSIAGNVRAAGNATSETSYSFADNIPSKNSFYRIAERGLDGRTQYTSILRSSCNVGDIFTVWPNPAHDNAFINIESDVVSEASIKIFDSKGALVKMQKATILQGSNQLKVDFATLSNGVYILQAEWNNGAYKKEVQLMKQ